MKSWTEGEPIDLQRMLFYKEGIITTVSTAISVGTRNVPRSAIIRDRCSDNLIAAL
ncbi:MAG: hypothetical protein HGA24_01365 [Candidatus Aminicenantes bacterium]|nr:hypothetical protein [Candidatus Aminicenantes bacterium]